MAMPVANPNAYAEYRKTQVATASPHKLVTMLYDAAIRRCHEAAGAIDFGNAQAAHTALLKAQDIVLELMTSLNHEAGGDIARQLHQLYTFMHQRLVLANLRKDAAAAREVAGLLEGLADAWRQIGPGGAGGAGGTGAPGSQATTGALRARS